MNLYRFPNCPCCGSTDIHKVGDLNYGPEVKFSSTVIQLDRMPELWQCQDCSSKFSQNILSEADANRLYAETDSAARWLSTPFSKSKTPDMLEVMGKLFKSHSRVLDIGCSTGELLDYARQHGCETTGIELSIKSLQVLSEKGHAAYLDTIQAGNGYDIVTAFDVIEHLHDPASFISSCAECLVPGGLLVILTGNINSFSARIARNNWWYMRYPEHIVFPSREFFISQPKFSQVSFHPTWANVYHRPRNIIDIIKNLSSSLHTGRPAIGPDHYLVAMHRI